MMPVYRIAHIKKWNTFSFHTFSFIHIDVLGYCFGMWDVKDMCQEEEH